MKKISIIVLSLVIVMALFISCHGGTERAPREFLQISTSAIGGTWHASGAAWAQLISQNSHFIAVNSTSPGLEFETMQRLEVGQVQLGFSGIGTAHLGRIPGKIWDEGVDVVALFATHPGFMNLIILDTPAITSVRDLRGRTIATYTSGNYWGDMAITFLELHGVTQENSRIMRIMKNDSARMLSDGQIDAIFHKYGHGHGTLRQLSTARRVRFLEGEPDLTEIFLSKYPFFRVEAFGDEFGIPNALQLVSNYVAITHSSLPKETAYLVTRIWFENRPFLMNALPNIAPWLPWDNPQQDVTIPFHPGAIRYFKEVGLWREL
ncbi:MAG: TAXI family TRAP transporter solute-binding subunit [Spirochaetes bacterium]|nr:TAXI family TRAP transporter solute-binding subunit [Spirochaetota bacterium]